MIQGGRDTASRSLLLVVGLLLAMAVGPLASPASAVITGERAGDICDYGPSVVERADVHGVVAHEGGLTQTLHGENGSAPPEAVGGAATCDYDALVVAHVDGQRAVPVKKAFSLALVGQDAPTAMANLLGDAATPPLSPAGTPRAAGAVDDLAGGVRFRSDTSHIFRDAPGHLVADTAANRSLISSAVSPNYLVSTRSVGGSTLSSYQRLLPDGRQVWVEVRNGVEITNGGVNLVPR